jgi:rhodanese-related sulfurtransferase
VAFGPAAKVSPTLRQRCVNGAVVHLSQELELREIHMTTPSAKAAFSRRPGASDGVLVHPEWLQAHLSDPHVRVVEVDVSTAAYDNWHIDGAVLWNIYTDLRDADYRLAGTASLERLVARSGIGPDSTVVFYGYAAALGLWLMKLYGHRDVRILDCSRDTWRAGGYPWSTAASEPPAGGFRLGGENLGIRADRAAVREAIGQPETTLVDVRSAAEYAGASASGHRAAWSQAAAPGTCLPPSTSPSTASTAKTGRSAPQRSCAACSRRPCWRAAGS